MQQINIEQVAFRKLEIWTGGVDLHNEDTKSRFLIHEFINFHFLIWNLMWSNFFIDLFSWDFHFWTMKICQTNLFFLIRILTSN